MLCGLDAGGLPRGGQRRPGAAGPGQGRGAAAGRLRGAAAESGGWVGGGGMGCGGGGVGGGPAVFFVGGELEVFVSSFFFQSINTLGRLCSRRYVRDLKLHKNPKSPLGCPGLVLS